MSNIIIMLRALIKERYFSCSCGGSSNLSNKFTRVDYNIAENKKEIYKELDKMNVVIKNLTEKINKIKKDSSKLPTINTKPTISTPNGDWPYNN